MTEREISDFGTTLYLDAFAVGRILARLDDIASREAVARLAESEPTALDAAVISGGDFARALKTLAMRLNRNALGDAQEALGREQERRRAGAEERERRAKIDDVLYGDLGDA